MDYWKECILGSFEESGITATNEQIEVVVGWVEGAHENYGMAFGHDCIPNPMRSEVEKLEAEIKRLKESHKTQLNGVAKGVARRRNVDVSCVSIDDNGSVNVWL